MLRMGITVSLALVLLAGVMIVRAEQQPREVKAKVEFKALLRSDIEDLAPEPVKEREEKSGHPEGSRTEALSLGMNELAEQGWELVAIEPHSEQQVKTPQGAVTYRHYPTYVFKRPR